MIANGIQNPNLALTDTGTLAVAEAAAAAAATTASDLTTLAGRVTALEAITWDDIQGPANDGLAAASLTREAYRDTPAILTFMRHDQDDAITFAFQMAHRWKRNSEVRVHAHYIPMVTPAADQVVRLVCRYAWAHSAAELPLLTSWGTATVDITIPAAGTHTFKEQLVSLFATTPTGSKESSILVCVVTRLSSAAEDSYTTAKSGGTIAANFCLLTIDAHYQVEKSGTTTEIPT
jgi:hypothetical protein